MAFLSPLALNIGVTQRVLLVLIGVAAAVVLVLILAS